MCLYFVLFKALFTNTHISSDYIRASKNGDLSVPLGGFNQFQQHNKLLNLLSPPYFWVIKQMCESKWHPLPLFCPGSASML